MGEAWYRLGMLLTLAAGVWEGPVAIVFRLFTDKAPTVLTAADYLPTPWCYVAAAGATIAALAVIVVLDAGHKRAIGRAR
ncbi:hypothetical protein GCM10023194_15540 [Planotetraspora phitsanulokensis]|uniref:Uncharacterized protein n=1 Tax=Planotetraspora phitsanulokensis TaxID=575192 RepID=A0A8J3UA86_9ACTN|nr:hypothetical protein [Planotetraspora phitsanulokensis]GII38834.1 hypothetical protein Pph01_38370 [Planotetraspora phitsanulokensis]